MAKVKAATQQASIKAPNLKVLEVKITGDSPLVMHAFSHKTELQLAEKHQAGSTAASKKDRTAKDFQQLFEDSMHKFPDGKPGIPAPAFRAAMIRACDLVNFRMTKAKCSIFVIPDGFDRDTPLVRFTKGEPKLHQSLVRLQGTTPDVRIRAMWDPGWEAKLRIRIDADQFTAVDVVNLLMRAGQQVGILEGRPFSKGSAGVGWGTFTVSSKVLEVSSAA